jgi:uncharacterized 2Fe-2S/4Fe-4S cluster protein (DUF4445 family)
MINGQKGIKELQNALVSRINEIIEECCIKTSVEKNSIYKRCFVGNTDMQLYFPHKNLDKYPDTANLLKKLSRIKE